jgi:hypothetical protein
VSRYTPWRGMGERRYSSYSYLTSATRWGWVVSVTPRPRFTPGERTPGTHWIGGWVGLSAGVDAGARRKILCPCRGSKPDRPARSQTLYCLNYRGSVVLGTTLFYRLQYVKFLTTWQFPYSKTVFPKVWYVYHQWYANGFQGVHGRK